jgi:hypothetical protein
MTRKRSVRARQPKTKSATPLRYLLSADRKLRRLSLKKMAERAKQRKGRARRRSRGLTPAAGTIPPGSVMSASTTRMVAAGGVGVIAAAILISAGVPSQSHAPARLAAVYESEARQRENVPPSGRRDIAAAATAPVVAPESSRPDVAAGKPSAIEPARAVAPARAQVTAVQPEARRAVADVTTAAAAGPSPAESKPVVGEPAAAQTLVSPEQADAAVIALTGCLVFERQTFWLKDAAGADARTTRSWRSGFLKKRAAAVELVDVPGTLELASYVGQRVAATGTLADRKMRPRSLQRVAASCS